MLINKSRISTININEENVFELKNGNEINFIKIRSEEEMSDEWELTTDSNEESNDELEDESN